MNLLINKVIRSTNEHGISVLERILWIDEGNIICFVIDIKKEANKYPVLRTIKEIKEGIESGLVTIERNTYTRFVHPSDITEEQAKYRDNAWEVIKEIASCEPDIYYKKNRGKMVREVMGQKGVKSHNTVNKYLKKYWRHGKIKNALLDDIQNCGGRGKPKTFGDKKFGKGNKIDIGKGEGINVTEEIKKYFRAAYWEFYATDKNLTLTKAFDFMLQKYFGIQYYNEKGVKQIHLQDDIPTIRQFRYFCENEPEIKLTLKKRVGIREYNSKHRPRKGSSTEHTYGPGVRFQIDATTCDYYLVSPDNENWIIGRPVLYFVIDVFSRMIVGYYVGLTSASWEAMMMAIANAALDKVEHCKRYEIEIEPSEWDVHCVPQFLLGDNGELKSNSATLGLRNGLHVTPEYAPPYRGDFKGIVERNFGVFHEETKPFIPGYVDKDRMKRGGKDYREKAKTTLFTFNRIIIQFILLHNNKLEITNYQRTPKMLKDNVPPIPREIWNWGLGKDYSKPREFDEITIKLNLMPTGKATVTRDGIQFGKMKYDSYKANEKDWYTKAHLKGNWEVDISYDPRNMNSIYIREKGGEGFISCTLNSYQEKFKNRDIQEIEYLNNKEAYDKKLRKQEQKEHKINFKMEIEHIVEEELRGRALSPKISKAQKIKGIKDNKERDREKLREEEAWGLDDTDLPNFHSKEKASLAVNEMETTSNVIEINGIDSENYAKTILKKKRKERFNERR
ncbi:Mu transposase C-terminal domain-containing protein [Cytobacillus sp. FSL R5-0596]|uniref:Mu transposase C-terminal domain-containing protein n=1 Tax=Cytobacillus sp. FSL R5-0596 TaxID=2954696 RepID=UPI0030F4FDA7